MMLQKKMVSIKRYFDKWNYVWITLNVMLLTVLAVLFYLLLLVLYLS